MKRQTAGEKTREKILNAGLNLWPNVTASTVGRAAGLSHAAVLYHFPGTLRDAVADHAVATGDSRVIVQLMAAGHSAVDKLSPADRIKHFNAI